MNGAQEIAQHYTLNQIFQARKVARSQGDTATAALLSQAYELRFEVLAERQERAFSGGNVSGVSL